MGPLHLRLMADRTIRWLHLSDFHVGKDDYAQRRIFERIIQHAKKKLETGFVPDFLFITGDLANNGNAAEYELFNLEFLLPLQEILGKQIEACTFAIPGNHDVDRSKNQAFDRREIADSKGRYFDPTQEGQELREMLFPRFKAFADNDLTLPKGLWCSSPNGAFSHVQEVNGVTVGIVGINTAWLSKDDKDRELLTPGKALVENVLQKVSDCDIRIVLGHHPLDWFVSGERKMIASLFGKSSAIYLHGHLHDAWAVPEYGGGYRFLSVQCGAAFQAREGEPWRNGLMRGEISVDRDVLSLQPWSWNAPHQDWALAADAFPDVHRRGDTWEYPLPGTQQAVASAKPVSSAPKVGLPKGWSLDKFDELKGHVAPAELEMAVRFFNGAVPGWHAALSSSTPRRSIVTKLTAHFEHSVGGDRPVAALLLGSAGEGKTTALLQTAYQILEINPKWKILRRADETQLVNPAQIIELVDAVIDTGDVLIVLDEADNAAKDLMTVLERSSPSSRSRTHFLMACRDTDWFASKSQVLPWHKVSIFRDEQLSGLDEGDATAIVDAWSAFGEDGLGDLAAVSAQDRVKKLIEAAKREAEVPQGAFFGALLAVRLGRDLHKHVRLLLDRLAQRPIRSGGTLQDAVAYIAAMHAEQLEFLSRPVLAAVLGCPHERLRQDVILPLGGEAAVTTTSSFVYTRHRRISEAVVSVLTNELGHDIHSLFISLAGAAIEAFSDGLYVPELASWRYDLSEHFFQNGKHELGISIAKAVLDREPLQSQTLVKLGHLYRQAGAADQAVHIFRRFPKSARVDRAFLVEWGKNESTKGDLGNAAILHVAAVADVRGLMPSSNTDAAICLTGLVGTFEQLYSAYSEPAFLAGRAAAAVLGAALDVPVADHMYFVRQLGKAVAQGAQKLSVEGALVQLKQSVLESMNYVTAEAVIDRIGQPDQFTFEGLAQGHSCNRSTRL
jgi:calcineurin-like phosphoesterase family protein